MNLTETDKEISFNSGKTHTPRRSRNCTTANIKELVTSNIFQCFGCGKINYGEKINFYNLYIQFQIFILHFTLDTNVLNIIPIYS